MKRGDIYLTSLTLPNRTPAIAASSSVKDKLLLIMNDGAVIGTAQEVAVLIISTWRGQAIRPYEVLVGTADGLLHDSVVDCRWPYTLPQSLIRAGRYICTLAPPRMTQVSVATVRGLQLR